MKKRILSMLLALTMLVGMIPATTLTATAATTVTEVDTWEELKTALTTSGTANIKLTADIECHFNSDDYGKRGTRIFIYGEKTLDLNGHSMKMTDWRNTFGGDYRSTSEDAYGQVEYHTTAFRISSGAKFTINDSKGGGEIDYFTAFCGDSSLMDLWGNLNYTLNRRCDIFEVYGTLIVNGGNIMAGAVQKEWIMNGIKNPSDCDWTSSSSFSSWTFGDPYGPSKNKIEGELYDGYARQIVWGTAVVAQNGGKVIVNDGTLSGRGAGLVRMTGGYDWVNRDEAVEIKEGGKVIVNGGNVIGNSCANAFSGDGVADGLTINGGFFKTDKHDNIRWFDVPGVHDHAYVESEPDTVAEIIFTGSYGNLGIPDSAWKNVPFRIQVIQNDTTLTGYDKLNALSLDKTGGQTSGDSLEVTILPYVSGKMLLTVNGGPYKNSLSADTTYKINYTDIDVTADYEPYFKDTTGLENYSITYTWSVFNSFSGSGGIDFHTTTTTNTLNLEDALRANTGSAAFKGTLKVKCTVVEQASNGSFLPIITEFFSAKFENIKTPLTEDALPGGKMDTVITYPDGSSGKTPVLITVKPLASQLAQDAYGNCTVEYQYDFRSWTGGTTKTYSNTGKLDCFALDYGHVKVATTMIVYGSEGQGRRFTDEAWALVLPEITATGGSWDSGKTAIIGSPGTRVMLKAPIDTVNAAVAADKITASDIAGWYKITYDSYGDEVYTYVSGSKGYATIGTLTGGTYCYAATDRDGNKVYSAPVKVRFSADAYSISITKSNNYSFYVCPDWANPVAQDITFTATIGSSVAKSNVWWKIVNAPQGFDIDTMSVAPIIINANRGLTPNFSDFIKNANLKSIPVGTYGVQAFVYKDGSYLSASNIIYVDVRRAESFVDITDAYGNVLSETTMEGPANGTMQLNCVPGNGGSNPVLKSVTWKVESLVGTNVATIDQNGLLTINKPGQIKVTATVTQENGEMITLKSNTQYVIINIPITEVEVTLGTPALGGDPASIASVSADAPYQVVYHVNKWVSGVSTKGVFMANGIPELCVTIAPKDGYVFPARQLYLENYDESWYTYADDMVVKVNGTSYNFRDFETTYTDGSSEYNGDYGTWYEAQSIDFCWTWDRLRDPSSTYLDYVNLTAPIPEVGHGRDLAPEDEYTAMLPICTNNSSIFTWVNSGGIYKVSGDYLNDNDKTNDNAVQMGETETYQMAQTYRADIYFNTNANRDGTYFAENVTLMINGQKCHIETLQGSTNLDGQDLAVAYYYFMPTAQAETISELYIAGLSTPVGYSKPATADSITEITSNFEIGDEVYVTRLQWFYDINNNGVIDSGEDTTFNANGSFMTGIPYSVYLELEARDRDDDGKGDYVKFADNVTIRLTDMSYATMTGNHNGAVYKFAAATAPATAVTADPASVTINLEEGYSGRPIKYINLASVGTTPVTSVVAAKDTDLIDVSCDGMTVAVMPAGYDLAVGRYNTVIYIQDDYGSVYTTIPVTINVTEKAAQIVQTDSGATYNVRLIEPWALRVNVRFKDASGNTIPVSEVRDYGAFAIRGSLLSSTVDVTVEQILTNTDTIHFPMGTEADGGMFPTGDGRATFHFFDGLYTYRLSEEVYWVAYYTDAEGQTYFTKVRNKSLNTLMNSMMSGVSDSEAEVYRWMLDMEKSILEYRNGRTSEAEVAEAVTLKDCNIDFRENSGSKYAFGRSYRISLIEPWGIMLNTRIYDTTDANTSSDDHIDYDAVDNYGMILYHDKSGSLSGIDDYTDLLELKDAYVYSKDQGNLSIDGTKVSVAYNKDIYTYELNSKIYCVTFVIIDGECYYSAMTTRNLYELMGTRIANATSEDAEIRVYKAMRGMYESVTKYRASL